MLRLAFLLFRLGLVYPLKIRELLLGVLRMRLMYLRLVLFVIFVPFVRVMLLLVRVGCPVLVILFSCLRWVLRYMCVSRIVLMSRFRWYWVCL